MEFNDTVEEFFKVDMQSASSFSGSGGNKGGWAVASTLPEPLIARNPLAVNHGANASRNTEWADCGGFRSPGRICQPSDRQRY
jgi:hypothetical protein